VSARGAYEAGNIPVLIMHMNLEQQAALQRAIVQQVVWHVERLLRMNLTEHQPELDLLNHWLADPQAASAIVRQIGIGPNGDPIFTQNEVARATIFLLRRIYVSLGNTTTNAVSVIIHARLIALGLGDTLYAPRSPNGRLILPDIVSNARRWQIEAAWAILNDQPIPPLEDVP
jgi:hypothetical protein